MNQFVSTAGPIDSLTGIAKAVKYARSIGYHYASIKASYVGMDVMLFFYRKGNGSWNALISTDTDINAKEAFRLYSRRWVIEVAHKEMKGLLNLGKCQCIDFAGQIAGLSFQKQVFRYKTEVTIFH